MRGYSFHFPFPTKEERGAGFVLSSPLWAGARPTGGTVKTVLAEAGADQWLRWFGGCRLGRAGRRDDCFMIYVRVFLVQFGSQALGLFPFEQRGAGSDPSA